MPPAIGAAQNSQSCESAVAVAPGPKSANKATPVERAGLTGAFGAVIAADEVPVPKPAPDLYLAACRLLGASPSVSVAFEDTWTGVAAAAPLACG